MSSGAYSIVIDQQAGTGPTGPLRRVLNFAIGQFEKGS